MKKLILLILFSSSIIYSQINLEKDTIKHNLNEFEINCIRADDETPITQSNIDKEKIKFRYFGQDLSFILNSTPSITSYSDNGLYNSYTYFRLRGIDQSRINMTLNGLPLNEPEDQGVYFSNYPDFGSNVNSVQIQRGVGTSTYGVSSYVGSINFEGPNLLDTNWISLEAGYGSYNGYRMSTAYNSGLNKKFAVYARYSMVGSDGYKYNAFNNSKSFFTSMGYYGKKDVLKLTMFSGVSDNGMGYLATNIEDINLDPRTNYLTSNEKDHFEQSFVSLQWTKMINTNSHITTSLFYNYLKGNYDVLFSPDMAKFNLESNFGGLTSNYSLNKKKLKLNLGISTFFYNRKHLMSLQPNISSYLYTNSGTKIEFSSFGKIQYKIKNFVLFADIQYRFVMFDYVPDNSNGKDLNNIYWNFINPKGGIKYIQNNHVSYYLSVGQTNREPTRNDLFNGYDNIKPINGSNYIGGTDTINIKNIKPESVIDIELGFDYISPKFKGHINGYYMDFKNEIAAIGRLSYIGLPLRKNVNSSFRSGVEIDLSYTPINGLTINQNFVYCYSKIREYTTDYDNITYKNVNPLLTPNIISNTNISYKNGWFMIGLSGRYVSKSYLDNTQNDNFITPDYFLLDGVVGLQYQGFEMKFMINNITNQRYYNSGYVGYNSSNQQTSAYFVGAPVNYYMMLSYKI